MVFIIKENKVKSKFYIHYYLNITVYHIKRGIFMKRISMIVMMSLFVVLFASSATAAETYMNLVLQSYEPYPAEPGSYITLNFKATNIGSKVAPDFTVKFVPKYPFSLDPNEDETKSFGSIDPTDDATFEYKVRIDERSVIGDNELTLDISNDGANWDDKDFDILVKISEAVLSVSDISTAPEQFVPGERSSLDITVENLAGTSLKDVSVKLDLDTETSMTTGTVLSDLPFAPVYSTTEKKVRYLSGGDSQVFSFNLMTYSNAESRLYKIPMTISYTDESGTTYSKTDLVGVVVGAVPKLTTLLEESDIRSAGGSGEVTIKLINKGVTNVKFLNIMIGESEEFDLLAASSESYIGNLDSDDYDTVTFRIATSSDVTDKVTIPLNIEYMDANNKPYTETVDLEMKILSASDLGEKSSNGGATFGVIAVVIVVIGFFVWKRKKNKRRHD